VDRKIRNRLSANPASSRKAEQNYARSLRKVANQVGHLIGAFPPDDPEMVPTISAMLAKYSEALDGWALRTASAMVAEVEVRDRKAWLEAAAEMSEALRQEIRSAPTGAAMKDLLSEQVTLIKSIPLDAAQRVHELTLKALEDSTRSKEIAAEIMRSGEVAVSRANLIARTETARTASALTQARAQHIGSEGYIWRTANDSDVRHSHKEMNGRFVRWDSPPTLSDGTTTHAGQIYNCRCYPEPVLPE
jgi:SPP1 gp7 family putative phage head morphogenesis protein